MDTAKKTEEIKLDKNGRICFTPGFFICAILGVTRMAIVLACIFIQMIRSVK